MEGQTALAWIDWGRPAHPPRTSFYGSFDGVNLACLAQLLPKKQVWRRPTSTQRIRTPFRQHTNSSCWSSCNPSIDKRSTPYPVFRTTWRSICIQFVDGEGLPKCRQKLLLGTSERHQRQNRRKPSSIVRSKTPTFPLPTSTTQTRRCHFRYSRYGRSTLFAIRRTKGMSCWRGFCLLFHPTGLTASRPPWLPVR